MRLLPEMNKWNGVRVTELRRDQIIAEHLERWTPEFHTQEAGEIDISYVATGDMLLMFVANKQGRVEVTDAVMSRRGNIQASL